jgi:hypothetical protein
MNVEPPQAIVVFQAGDGRANAFGSAFSLPRDVPLEIEACLSDLVIRSRCSTSGSLSFAENPTGDVPACTP